MTSAALIASLSAPAFAANFSDVQGTKFDKAAALLKALKVVNGETDGQYHPEQELTRAQFAKIAVQLAGLSAAADATGTNANPFNDVQAGYWAAGYIQVAKDAGLVQGYDALNFGPDDKVKYEQVLAVALRILGYSDSKLQGQWPTKYVIKGAELGIYKDASFVVGKEITRGDLALIANATLDTPVVTFDSQLNQFVRSQDPNGGSTLSLISKNFTTAVSAKVALTDASDLAGSNLLAGQILVGGVTKTLADDVTIVGGASAADLVGRTVQYVEADDKVVYLADVTSATVVNGTAEVDSTATTVRVNGKDYNFSTANVYRNKSVAIAPAAGVVKKGDAVTLILKNDGTVEYAVVNHVNTPVITGDIYAATSVTKASIAFNGGAYTIGDKTTFTLNGQAATLADMKKGDVLYATLADDNSVVNIAAYRNTVTVKVDSITSDNSNLKTVVVGGTTYNVNSAFTIAATDVAAGKEYVLTLDKEGKIAAVKAVEAATNNMLVMQVDIAGSYLDGNTVITSKYIRFLDSQGNEVKKFVPELKSAADYGIAAGEYGTFSLDDKGLINAWKEEGTTAATKVASGTISVGGIDATAKTLVVNGNKYFLQDNTVYYDVWDQAAATPVVDYSKSELAAIKNLKEGEKVTLFLDAKDNSKVISVELEYDSGVSAQMDAQSGVLVGKKTVQTAIATTYYVTLNVNGSNVDYKLESDVALTATAGDLVQLTDASTGKTGTYDAVYNATPVSAVYNYSNVANAFRLDNSATGAINVYTSNTKVYVVKYVGDDYTKNRDAAIVGNLSDFTSLLDRDASTSFKFEVDYAIDKNMQKQKIAGYDVVDAVVVYLKK